MFACSATFENESLNKHVIQAPDHLNSLIELLTRFRKEEVAFTCDIEQMFHSFNANPKDRNFLGFLWSENNDPTKPIVEYRMNVHFFGAASSPGVTAFCLHQTAETLREEFGRRFRPSPILSDLRDFYMDDGLRSVPTAQQALQFNKDSQAILLPILLQYSVFFSRTQDL